ncbi:MAG: tautomerase family protein [Caulobacteraceae bacterium]
MPEVIVHAVEGRTPEQKKALCADITAAVVKHFNAPMDAVTVVIIDNPKDSKGDVLGAVAARSAPNNVILGSRVADSSGMTLNL